MGYEGKFKSFFERSASSPESWRPLDFSVTRSDDGFETSSKLGAGSNVETLSGDFPPSDGDQCQMCGTHIIHKFVIQHGSLDGDEGGEAEDLGGRVLWAFVGSECITNFVDDVFSARLDYAKRTARKEKRAVDIERSETTLMETIRSAANIMAASAKAKMLPDQTLFKKFGSEIEEISAVILNAKQAQKNKISREEVEDSCLASLRILTEAFSSSGEDSSPSIKIETLREVVRAVEVDTFDEAMTMLGLGISFGEKGAGKTDEKAAELKPMVDLVSRETMRRLTLLAESAASLRDVAKFGSAVRTFKVAHYMFPFLKKIDNKSFVDKKASMTGKYVELGLSRLHAVMASHASELAESMEFKVMLFSISQDLQYAVTTVPGWAEERIARKLGEVSLANLEDFSGRLRLVYNRNPSSFYQTLVHITNAGEKAAEGGNVANFIDAHIIMKRMVEYEGAILRRGGFSKPDDKIEDVKGVDPGKVASMIARIRGLFAKDDVVMRPFGTSVKTYGYRVKQHYVGPRREDFSQATVQVLEDEGFKFNASTGGVYHESIDMAHGLAGVLAKIVEEKFGNSAESRAS